MKCWSHTEMTVTMQIMPNSRPYQQMSTGARQKTHLHCGGIRFNYWIWNDSSVVYSWGLHYVDVVRCIYSKKGWMVWGGLSNIGTTTATVNTKARNFKLTSDILLRYFFLRVLSCSNHVIFCVSQPNRQPFNTFHSLQFVWFFFLSLTQLCHFK